MIREMTSYVTQKKSRQIYRYKNTKLRLYKNNAAIGFNKTCKAKQLTPTYVNIKIKADNPRFHKTKNPAVRYTTNQQLKFQYAKKQQLNEKIYKFHL